MLSCNKIKITQWNSLTTDCRALVPKSSSRGTTDHSSPSTRTTSLNEVKSQPILQSPDLTSQRSPCIYLNLKGFLALTSSNKRIRSAGTRGIISSFRGSGNTAAFYWGNQEAAVIDMAF
ncbi:hypothetical protein CDAR_420631 [Caerostris darwini]|uniref:Uncharacterized protein n=1 Tax=Caerostris darwini TaxID=1538125 RepID=A0AAV4QFY3_9ARAC|nr:hypothetical protein CDAR_420631 [Caerostris darwini]